MGKKKSIIKVVLDTNVLISALLFRKDLANIVDLWKAGTIIPVLSKDTFKELTTVLQYPKFSLTKEEIRSMIYEEILPFFEITEVKNVIEGICKDPDDDKFINSALSSKANFIVSGDKHLTGLKNYRVIRISTPAELLKMF